MKAIVDEAEEEAERGERIPLFLLDEILRGTNSGERQVAVKVLPAALSDNPTMRQRFEDIGFIVYLEQVTQPVRAECIAA